MTEDKFTCWVPAHFRKKMDWKDVKGSAPLAEMVCQKKYIITLEGKTGTGKTHSAIALVKHMLIYAQTQFKDRSAHFVNFGEYYLDYVENFASGGLKMLNQKMRESDYLILDDFGLEKAPSDAFADVLYSIVNQRINENKYTIVTTNLTEEEILSTFGKRIHSRLYSGGYLHFTGKDRRI